MLLIQNGHLLFWSPITLKHSSARFSEIADLVDAEITRDYHGSLFRIVASTSLLMAPS